MTADLALRASVGLLPVLCFLAAMRLFDSYKLVHLRPTLLMIGAGALCAVASYWVGAAVINGTGLEFKPYSRYVAPPVEELLKGAIIVWLVARHRVAFLVDAAISGFAVGAGFAMLENLFYLRQLPDAPIGVWIVRGFGTAIMHGGTTAMFGVLGLILSERAGGDHRQRRPQVHQLVGIEVAHRRQEAQHRQQADRGAQREFRGHRIFSDTMTSSSTRSPSSQPAA